MKQQTLVIATGNPGKVQEFQNILGTEHFVFKTLRDIHFHQEIQENGDSFTANSLIKAQAVRDFLDQQALDWPVLADDSGLEVEALQGAPGIFTARFAGEGASDEANYQKLLHELKEQSNRQARFVCVLTYLASGQKAQIFRGSCPGSILEAPMGTQGFGYDPVFQPQGHTRSFGQMTHQEKKTLSHRGEAIQQLQSWLQQQNHD